MKPVVLLAGLAALSIYGCGKSADQKAQAAAGLTVANGWCRASPQGAKTASCFLTVTNNGPADDLMTGGQSSSARTVEVDETYADGNILRMRPVKGLAIPAHKDVALAAGANVIRLIDLNAPLVVGSTVPVTLKFQAAGEKQVLFPVRVEAADKG